MKKCSIATLVLATLLLAPGCGGSRPLGHFLVNPDSPPYAQKILTPLYIVLQKGVADELTIGATSDQKLRVTNFRMSVKDALSATFSKNFQTIYFVDSVPERELTLILTSIHPSWEQNDPGLNPRARLNAHFSVQTVLRLDNAPIQAADLQVTSRLHTDAHGLPEVFKDGLRVSCERLNESIFTPEIVTRIQ
ncbi:hypothetical protein CLV98_11184 [Dyadobacter jejuensis]|uniref:ABC-type transport auxiliary lipoprotein component domain-containing protein n=1 Tax=Dyadobacter jejuensis TaxID=1082580 RepID=A0A316AI94_9BACT|nr:hypothetical protein [Dyadobacter jejuensis]PWJ56590.1 hypothetical protein CLV98_11184 [Dyadobacter jejuensis]